MRISDIINEATDDELMKAGLLDNENKSIYSDEFLYCLHLYVMSAGWQSLDAQTKERITMAFNGEMPPLILHGLSIYRGIGMHSLPEPGSESDFINNDCIRFDGFLSFSLDAEYAKANTTSHEYPYGAIFELKIPNGVVKGIDLHDFSDYDFFFEDEQEIILQQNLSFDVIDRHMEVSGTDDNRQERWHVKLELAHKNQNT